MSEMDNEKGPSQTYETVNQHTHDYFQRDTNLGRPSHDGGVVQ